jgi:MFS family permease
LALIATIALYSSANIANAFVTNVEQYALLRFLAGAGLAGELGAGVTLISELLPKRLRGYGTTVISFLGLLGALTAALIGGQLDWRLAYGLGGGMGLLVLVLRIAVLQESAMFAAHRGQQGQGDWRRLFGRLEPALRFAQVVAVGVPLWYVSALFVNFAPEYGSALGFSEPLKVSDVLLWQASGLAIGSALSGLISEWLQSRKRVIGACLMVLALGVLALLHANAKSTYIALMLGIGLAQGYWTAFITMSAEQFGTNLRATVATSVPNVVRAMTVPVTLSLQALQSAWGLIPVTLSLGVLVFSLGLLSLWRLDETWGRDLDFRED